MIVVDGTQNNNFDSAFFKEIQIKGKGLFLNHK